MQTSRQFFIFVSQDSVYICFKEQINVHSFSVKYYLHEFLVHICFCSYLLKWVSDGLMRFFKTISATFIGSFPQWLQIQSTILPGTIGHNFIPIKMCINLFFGIFRLQFGFRILIVWFGFRIIRLQFGFRIRLTNAFDVWL